MNSDGAPVEGDGWQVAAGAHTQPRPSPHGPTPATFLTLLFHFLLIIYQFIQSNDLL